ncbi:MAG TPA: hypothetical protein VGR34_06595, partial [Candidatus Dormibacteraeota bacterium]|nr:hypothetical protein [Candidatus Dormibacteraeota bacterium]
TSGPTTTSTTFAVLSEMTKTITTKGNKVLITFWVIIYDATGAGGPDAIFGLFRDGTQITTSGSISLEASFAYRQVTITYVDSPTAASHTYDIRWKSSGGAHVITALTTARGLQVTELG